MEGEGEGGGRLSGGGGGGSGAVLAGEKYGTPAAQGEFKVIPGPISGNSCFFVFDWWGVSTAIQIRLYAGLLSVLPLKVCGMSLHVHGAVTENG